MGERPIWSAQPRGWHPVTNALPFSRNAPLAITGIPRVSSWADVSPVSAMAIQTAAFLALAFVW